MFVRSCNDTVSVELGGANLENISVFRVLIEDYQVVGTFLGVSVCQLQNKSNIRSVNECLMHPKVDSKTAHGTVIMAVSTKFKLYRERKSCMLWRSFVWYLQHNMLWLPA